MNYFKEKLSIKAFKSARIRYYITWANLPKWIKCRIFGSGKGRNYGFYTDVLNCRLDLEFEHGTTTVCVAPEQDFSKSLNTSITDYNLDREAAQAREDVDEIISLAKTLGYKAELFHRNYN